MPSPHERPPIAIATILLSALSLGAPACGKGDQVEAEGESAARPAPSAQAKPPPERPLREQDLEKACAGAPEARVRAYDPKDPRIHPLIVFERDGDAGKYQKTGDAMLEDWQAEKAADYELVACITKKNRNKVRECAFTDKKPARHLEVYEATYEISIHEASTGKQIATKTAALGPSLSDCPMMWMFNKEREASDPGFTTPLISVAKPLVMTAGDATLPPVRAATRSPLRLLKSDLEKVCSELPERRTKPYEKKPGELQPLLVFTRTGDNGDYSVSYSTEFSEFETKTEEEYKLVACVTEKSRTKVRECPFDDKKPTRYVDMYDAKYEIAVFEASTAKKLASKELAMKAESRCPTFWMFRGDRAASLPSIDKQVASFVKPFTSPK